MKVPPPPRVGAGASAPVSAPGADTMDTPVSGSVPASMRVLVVDDEVNLRFAIERRLRKEGLDTAAASTVRQAIDRLRAEPYDVVVSDLRMPGGDGTQLLQWVGSHAPSTKVIILSAFVTREFRAEYAPSANLRIMEKPADLDELVRMVRELGARQGFYGIALEVELFDYVQMVTLSGGDRLIELHTPDGTGRVWFDTGDIVHVEFGAIRGEAAFYKLLSIGRGTFKESLYRPPAQRSVTCSSTHLLMEAARLKDEGLLGGPVAPSGDGAPAFDDEEEASFAELDDDASASQSGTVPRLHDDAVVAHEILDQEFGSIPIDIGGPAGAMVEVMEDPETRQMLLGQFWAFEGVRAVAIVTSTGKVLAEDLRGHDELVTLGGFFMRGAARLARSLGYNVFDGVIIRDEAGHQMLVVSMGPTSVLLAVDDGYDAEAIRRRILGIEEAAIESA